MAGEALGSFALYRLNAVTTRVRGIWNNVNAVGERWVLGSGFWADRDIKFCEISLAAQILKRVHSVTYL